MLLLYCSYDEEKKTTQTQNKRVSNLYTFLMREAEGKKECVGRAKCEISE